MRYEIILAPEAVEDFKRLSARDRFILRSEIDRHLRFDPKKSSKSRIKRLKGISKPQYCLRVDEYRVFYGVVGQTVEILAIVRKPEAAAWLDEAGEKQ
jgi:mRNA-degrading endonuclease RelE of RelBE toxin-antitoxin system